MPDTFAALGNETVCGYVVRRMESYGMSLVDDPSSADVVFTYFTGASMVEDAYFDDEGLVKRAKEGALFVDLSPCAPSVAREIAAVVSVNGQKLVEAPIAVVDPTLEDAFRSPGNLVCFLAGEQDDVALAREIVEELADDVRLAGGPGCGQLAKASCTVQQSAQIIAAIECDELSRAQRAAGVAGDVFDGGAEPLAELSGLMIAAVRAEIYEGTYTIEMLMGDVVAAMTAADDVDLILPQLEAVMHLLEIVAIIGGADLAPAALSLIYRDEATGAAHGLDWSRAEGLFADGDHGHLHDAVLDDAYDYDDLGFSGGFGGYSAN